MSDALVADGHHLCRNFADVFGATLALNNPAFLDGPEATVVGFATWLYTSRNFAVGIAFVAAYLLRNAPIAIYFDSHQVADRSGRWPCVLNFRDG